MISSFRTAFERLESARIDWVLTGSLAFALQGLPYAPNDIDIQTDEKGAYVFGDLMAEFKVVAVHPRRDSPLLRSHFGSFNVRGVQVEVMGDMQKVAVDGTWESPPKLSELRRYFDFEGLRVPIFPLNYEAESYGKMRRFDKARTLAEWAAKAR